jgi:hypothetical protein
MTRPLTSSVVTRSMTPRILAGALTLRLVPE